MTDYSMLLKKIANDIIIVEEYSKEENLRKKYMDKTRAYLQLLSLHMNNAEDDFKYCEIKIVYEKVKDAWLEYLKGNVESANSKFRNLLNRRFAPGKLIDMMRKTISSDYDDDSIVIGIKEDFKRLYRCRVEKNDKEVIHDGIFHIAYDSRQCVSAQRYSIQGFPMLYLGTSPEGCTKEIRNIEKNQQVWISQFSVESKEPVYVVDVSLMPDDLLGYIEGKGIDKSEVESWVINYLYILPIVIACYYYSTEKDLAFHNEYVVPQMLTHALRNAGAKGKEKACCIKYRSVRNSDRVYNYVLFPPTINAHERFSEYLRERVSWSTPVIYDLFDETIVVSKQKMEEYDRKKVYF